MAASKKLQEIRNSVKKDKTITGRNFANSRTDFSVYDKAVFESFLYKPDDLRTREDWVKEAQAQGILDKDGVKPKL